MCFFSMVSHVLLIIHSPMVLTIAWSSYGAAVALAAREHHSHQQRLRTLCTALVKTLMSGGTGLVFWCT